MKYVYDVCLYLFIYFELPILMFSIVYGIGNPRNMDKSQQRTWYSYTKAMNRHVHDMLNTYTLFKKNGCRNVWNIAWLCQMASMDMLIRLSFKFLADPLLLMIQSILFYPCSDLIEQVCFLLVYYLIVPARPIFLPSMEHPTKIWEFWPFPPNLPSVT